MRVKHLLLLLLCAVCVSCLKEELNTNPYKTTTPFDLNDGTETTSLTRAGIDSTALAAVYNEVDNAEELYPIRSLLVYRGNKLASEAYFQDATDIENQRIIWSCTKQFVGVLVGMALEKGLIEDINDPISKYLADEIKEYPDKADIRIVDLLNMRSGIGFSNDGVSGNTDKILREQPDDITKYILSQPMKYEPGTHFNYNDGDPQLLSAIIQKAAGKPLDEWADEVLFRKIGFENYTWVRYRDNVSLGGFGLKTSPRELGKFGNLVANYGKHNDIPIVDSLWIAKMWEPQIHGFEDFSFGYQWWFNTKHNWSIAWGHGGQFIFIIPEKDLVVVVTSIHNTQGNHQIIADEMIPYLNKITSACN